MAFCHLYYWERGLFGHTGLAIQTPSGQKAYISLLNVPGTGGDQGRYGFAPSLPSELRQWTGIGSKGNFDQRARMHAIATTGTIKQNAADPGRPFRPQAGQGVVPASTAGVAVGHTVAVGAGGMRVRLAAGTVYQEPTEIVDIPVYTSTTLGIDTDMIFHWWRSYGARGARADGARRGRQTPRVEFKLLTAWNNCAGTTALALKVGGATFFSSRHGRHWSTPKGVRDWARGVAATAREINRAKAMSIQYEMKQARLKREKFEAVITRTNQQQAADDLPTLQEWQTISYVGVFARRKEQIATIDGHLREYHRFPWGTQHDDTKAAALDDIIRQAENHAITKPNSDRMHAVAYLLAQGWKVLDRRLQELAAAPDQMNARMERDRHGSLAFSPEELQKVFLGDTWLQRWEYDELDQPVVEEGGVSEELIEEFERGSFTGRRQDAADTFSMASSRAFSVSQMW